MCTEDGIFERFDVEREYLQKFKNNIKRTSSKKLLSNTSM